jgi:NADH-quinone oxidoreductase subunit N
MDVKLLLPEVLLLSLAVLLLILDWFLDKKQKPILGYVAIFGLILIFLVIQFLTQKNIFSVTDLAMQGAGGKVVFQGFVLDTFTLFFKQLFILIALLASIFSLSYFKKNVEGQGEYYALLLFITLGCFLFVSASDLLILFVSFELLSIPLYVLCAYLKKDARSSEAGLKYFLIGVVTSALLLYGMSLVYASIGSTDLVHLVSTNVISLPKMEQNPLLLIGLLFMICAFAFKIAAVPFHMWAPDVYEGAPAPVVAFLATAPKMAVIGLLTRLFLANMSSLQPFWSLIFMILSALSMTVGNLGALHQQNLKRLLAYSGISQIGYLLVGFSAMLPMSSGVFPPEQQAYQAVLFYVVAYTFAELAAFGVVAYLSENGYESVSSLQGFASQNPMLAFIFLLALLSLAGVPPLVGFAGKFYLFASALNAKLYWLVVLGVVNSVISLFYYLRVAKVMYFNTMPQKEEGAGEIAPPSFLMRFALFVACLVVVLVGIYPTFVVRVSQSALYPLSRVFF